MTQPRAIALDGKRHASASSRSLPIYTQFNNIDCLSALRKNRTPGKHGATTTRHGLSARERGGLNVYSRGDEPFRHLGKSRSQRIHSMLLKKITITLLGVHCRCSLLGNILPETKDTTKQTRTHIYTVLVPFWDGKHFASQNTTSCALRCSCAKPHIALGIVTPKTHSFHPADHSSLLYYLLRTLPYDCACKRVQGSNATDTT